MGGRDGREGRARGRRELEVSPSGHGYADWKGSLLFTIFLFFEKSVYVF